MSGRLGLVAGYRATSMANASVSSYGDRFPSLVAWPTPGGGILGGERLRQTQIATERHLPVSSVAACRGDDTGISGAPGRRRSLVAMLLRSVSELAIRDGTCRRWCPVLTMGRTPSAKSNSRTGSTACYNHFDPVIRPGAPLLPLRTGLIVAGRRRNISPGTAGALGGMCVRRGAQTLLEQQLNLMAWRRAPAAGSSFFSLRWR